MAEWPGTVETEQWPGQVEDGADLVDPHEIEYANAKRGVISDQEIQDNIRQYRAIIKSDAGIPTLGQGKLPTLPPKALTTPSPQRAFTIPPETSLNPEGFTPTPSRMANLLEPAINAIPGLGTGLEYLAAPGDYLRGALSGMTGERVGPAEFMGLDPSRQADLAGAIRMGAGMAVDPLVLLGPLVGGVARGLRGTPRIPAVSPIGTAELPIGEVDTAIGAKPGSKIATGTPDSPVPGSRVDETGKTIAQQAKVPADFPDEQYTLFNPEPVAPNTRILQPEEQLGIGETKLRPQVLRKQGVPEVPIAPNKPGSGIEDTQYPGLSPTAEAMKPVTEALQKLSKREVWKQHLHDSHTPQGDWRIKLQTSPRGSVSVIEAEKDAGLRYSHISEAPSDLPLVFPGWPSRITQSITDTFRQIGPAGRNIGNAIDNVLTNRAILSSADTIGTVAQLRQVAGTRGMASKAIEGFRELTQGENAFIWGSHRYFDLSNSEIEQAYNYLYTGGRMVPTSTKAKVWADKLYEGMLLPASRAAHEAGLDLYNPLTGKHEPYGAPSMFMPQIPEKAVSLKGISDTHLELLYNRQGGANGTGKSFPMWKAQLSRILAQGGELREAKALDTSMSDAAARYDIASKRYKGLEVTRLLDLEALGGSPYQWAKKLGYGTDPFRNAFRFNSSAHLRSEWAKALPQMEQDLARIAEAGGSDLTEWSVKAIERAQGINTGLTETRILGNLVKGVRDFNNATMLQLGGLGSLPQLGYALGRAPLTRSMLGAVDFVLGKNKNIIEKSGALFPTMMNHMIQPEGPLATVSTGALRGYGVSAADKWSRYFGAHVGNRYVDFLESALLKHPQKQRLHSLIEEMGGNVNQIMKEGKIPEPMRLAMIQRYANYSAGIPDPRGLPLIATSETAYARLSNQYRTFMFNNQAELVRLWKQAPTTHDAINRITKVLVGTSATSAVTGAMSEYIRNAFNDEQGNPFVNKRLTKIVGDEGAAFAIQTIAYGMGALFASLTLTALDNGWKLAAGLALGPTGGLLEGVSEDVIDTIINGPNAKSLRTAARRTPGIGPVLAPIVRGNIKEQADEARREQQLQRALMPPSGFENEP